VVRAALPETWVVIFFLRGGFLTTPDSAGSMAQRDSRRILGLDMHHRAAGPMGRCPVQPSTPLGPDQVNVIYMIYIYIYIYIIQKESLL
jgi:hypothetical protein